MCAAPPCNLVCVRRHHRRLRLGLLRLLCATKKSSLAPNDGTQAHCFTRPCTQPLPSAAKHHLAPSAARGDQCTGCLGTVLCSQTILPSFSLQPSARCSAHAHAHAHAIVAVIRGTPNVCQNTPWSNRQNTINVKGRERYLLPPARLYERRFRSAKTQKHTSYEPLAVHDDR